MSVDLTNGNRTQIADLDSSAPAVNYASNMRLDVKGNRVLFTDAFFGGNSALYAIDLATGARTTITDANRGTGPIFGVPANITLEPADNPVRALVSDTGLGGIYLVDLATGNRSMLIEPFPATEVPGDNAPTGTFLDAPNSRLLVVRTGTVSNLFSVALPSGTQRILSGYDPSTTTIAGTGPLPFGCFPLDVSATDAVAFVGCPWFGALMAIDLVSGDRVVIAH